LRAINAKKHKLLFDDNLERVKLFGGKKHKLIKNKFN
jgi:hypothetical protein